MIEVTDMLKLESPFVRKLVGKKYLVTPDINPGYEWVFDDTTVLAIEKLDGTNVSIVIEDGIVKQIWNRKNRILTNGIPTSLNAGQKYIVEGVLTAIEKHYCNLSDGQHFGEVIGPKFGRAHEGGANPYKLDQHIWIPFKTYSKEHLAYKSWGKYPKDFDTISKWFESNLMPLYFLRKHGKDAPNQYVEGIVFTHPDGRMAKLRRDMFEWFKGPQHGE